MESIISVVFVVIGSVLSVVPILLVRLRRRFRTGQTAIGTLDLTDEQRAELRRQLEEDLLRNPPPKGSSRPVAPGTVVLLIFATIVVVFGLITLTRYWAVIKEAEDKAYLFGWLVLLMIAGMFVQVLEGNYRNGKQLFDVTATQLALPLLFSVVVFYPIWAIGTSATDKVFAIYAAFLNGYFWETVVTNMKRPTPSASQQ